MSLYVLDTDILTHYQRGQPAVVRHVLAHPPAELAVTIISLEEELTGWYTKLRRAKKREQLAKAYQQLTEAVQYMAQFQILSFTEPAIVRYEQLRLAHRNLGKNDLRIAAIVLEHGGILATANIRDFRRIPGLQIEDWSK